MKGDQQKFDILQVRKYKHIVKSLFFWDSYFFLLSIYLVWNMKIFRSRKPEAMVSFLLGKYPNHRTTKTGYSSYLWFSQEWKFSQTICCQLCRGYIYHRDRKCVIEGRNHWMEHMGNYTCYCYLEEIEEENFDIFIMLSYYHYH